MAAGHQGLKTHTDRGIKPLTEITDVTKEKAREWDSESKGGGEVGGTGRDKTEKQAGEGGKHERECVSLCVCV